VVGFSQQPRTGAFERRGNIPRQCSPIPTDNTLLMDGGLRITPGRGPTNFAGSSLEGPNAYNDQRAPTIGATAIARRPARCDRRCRGHYPARRVLHEYKSIAPRRKAPGESLPRRVALRVLVNAEGGAPVAATDGPTRPAMSLGAQRGAR